MKRVALLTGFLPPYRKSFIERLASIPGWRLRVLVNADTEFDRSWPAVKAAADVRRVPSWAIRRRVVHERPIRYEQRVTLHLPVGLWGELWRFRPDVVISLELGVRTAIAGAYCKARRVPLIVRSYHSRAGSSHRRVRGAWRRFLLRRAKLVLGMGRQAREVLTSWGVAPDRIVDTLNCVDPSSLEARLADPELPRRIEAVRSRVAAGRRIALVVGRLVPLKGVAPLLAAWSAVPAETRDAWRLVFVGDGVLQPLVEQAAALGVVRAGFVPYHEIADWYRAADLCIFASLGDVWGLVVNEALHCGTPLLCSVHAAACDDLIEHGVNGLTFDPTDREAAVAALEDALSRGDLAVLGAAGPASVEGFSEDRMAAGFREAVERANGVSGGALLRRAPGAP
jgi:hypothetical protein